MSCSRTEIKLTKTELFVNRSGALSLLTSIMMLGILLSVFEPTEVGSVGNSILDLVYG